MWEVGKWSSRHWEISCFSPLIQALKLDLKEIREQQDLFFLFMNFLKQEAAVHVLQFCLDVGKIMNLLSVLILYKTTFWLSHRQAPCKALVKQSASKENFL